MYFERFLRLDNVAIPISGTPIRFAASDFSYVTVYQHCKYSYIQLLLADSGLPCMIIINITGHFASCKPHKSLEVHHSLKGGISERD